MQKPKNTDSEHLLGDNLKKAAKKAKTSNNMFKKSTNRHSSSNNHSKFKFPSNRSQNQDFVPWPQSFVKQSETQKVQQPEQPPKLPDQEPVCSKDKEIGTAQVIDSPKIMFIAGNLKHCYPAWQEITSDPVILNIINKGWQINVKNHIPCKGPFEHKHSQRDSDIISEEIKKAFTKTSHYKM